MWICWCAWRGVGDGELMEQTLEAPPPAFITPEFLKDLARTTTRDGLAVCLRLRLRLRLRLCLRLRLLTHSRACLAVSCVSRHVCACVRMCIYIHVNMHMDVYMYKICVSTHVCICRGCECAVYDVTFTSCAVYHVIVSLHVCIYIGGECASVLVSVSVSMSVFASLLDNPSLCALARQHDAHMLRYASRCTSCHAYI